MIRVSYYVLFGAMMACSIDHIGLSPSDPDADQADASMLDARAPDVGFDATVDTGIDANRRDVGLPDGGPIDSGPVDVGVDAGPMDAGPMDAGCPVRTRCSGDGSSLETCRGGVFSPVECPVRCDDSATAQCMDFEPSNALGAFLDRGEGSRDFSFPTFMSYEEAAGMVFNTNGCMALPGSQGLHLPPGGDTQVCVLAFDDVSISGKVTVIGQHGLAIVASGTITLEADGMIRADGLGQPGGPGGGDGATTSTDAEGPYAGPNGAHARLYDDAGGTGGGNGTPGGSGGAAAEAPAPGPSGVAELSDLLDPIHGGSGGGVGGTGGRAGVGGGGGGALILIARDGIVLNGIIDISGGGGAAGLGSFDNFGGGGGGGSGGGLVLETAGTITVGAEALIFASGAGGGGSADCEGDGTNGLPEQPGNLPLGGLAAVGPCTFGDIASDGGDGAYDGEAGTGDSNGFYGSNGGGGGGGQGIVVIRADVAPVGPYGFSGQYRVGTVELTPVL